MPADDSRHAVSPEIAVALAVGSARLEGLETPPDLEALALRVTKGEITADEAVQTRLATYGLGRYAVSPETAVALAVADNRLEGIDTPPDLEAMMLRVAKGEISADEAIRERLSALLPARDLEP
jgi:hypothetical protein